jgi:hypothetical protein
MFGRRAPLEERVSFILSQAAAGSQRRVTRARRARGGTNLGALPFKPLTPRRADIEIAPLDRDLALIERHLAKLRNRTWKLPMWPGVGYNARSA